MGDVYTSVTLPNHHTTTTEETEMSERTPVYLHDWEERGEAQMISDFEITAAALVGATILVASYTYEDYSGSAYVLFERDGKIFEVHGGHCSCYGLEGQWEPEEADKDAIIHRVTNGSWGEEYNVRDAIVAALQVAA